MNNKDIIEGRLEEASITVEKIEFREFPGEKWAILHVADRFLIAAQSIVENLEMQLMQESVDPEEPWTIVVRPLAMVEGESADAVRQRGALFNPSVDKLIQLLEARSRTSLALPSLKYVEAPTAGLASMGAARHHVIYGRRGVGKTALMLESMNIAGKSGHVTQWFNAHIVRDASPEFGFLTLVHAMLLEIGKKRGGSASPAFDRIDTMATEVAGVLAETSIDPNRVRTLLPRINSAVAGVLRPDVLRLFVYIDDLYLIPVTRQPAFLDYLSGVLRDCNGWIKVASIERLTRPFEPSTRVGLEIPHDASVIDIDVTLEDPANTQTFLEEMLVNYLEIAGIKSLNRIASSTALGRLVLASGGVPRDYLNLVASSIGVARRLRDKAATIGKEDVAQAAGEAARSKKRDLEQDVVSSDAQKLLNMMARLSEEVKKKSHTYFIVNFDQKSLDEYTILAKLVDLRFAHLLQTLSAQHKPGVRYEAYMLDLSEFAEIRLQRGLNVLDLDRGAWIWRLTGTKRTERTLKGTGLRDKLRNAPEVDLKNLMES